MATIERLMTTLDAGTDPTAWVDNVGASVGGANIETFPPGALGSVSEKVSKDADGLMFDNGTTGFLATGDHLTMWYALLFGAMDTQAGIDSETEGGGIRFRLTGATATDFAEVFIDGSDTGKTGWQFAVVSVDRILSSPDQIGGGPPTAAADVQRAGIIFDINETIGGNNDNIAVQAIHLIPAGTSAFRIQGDGSSPTVTWEDIASGIAADAGRGIVLKESNGVFTLNAPLDIGDDGTAGSPFDTDLSDSGVVLAWDNQVVVEPDFFEIVMNANGTETTDLNAGTKIGSGADAVGVGGWTIITGGPLWRFQQADTDVAGFNLYGCSFSGSRDWDVDDPATEILSCVFSNCGTIDMTIGSAGPAILSKNFFSDAPGPRAQVVCNTSVSTPLDFATNQFILNSFTNMKWFGVEFPVARDAGYTMDLHVFAGNGTPARDVLASHDGGESNTEVLLNLTTGSGTPNIVNGSTILVTMGGTPDVFLYTVATWEEVQTAAGTDQSDASGTLASLNSGALAVDDDTFAASAARVGLVSALGIPKTITQSGASDNYADASDVATFLGTAFDRDTDFLSALIGYIDELTPSTTARVSFPEHVEAETESANVLITVNAAAGATPVVLLDPEFRPMVRVSGASTDIFGYGAGATGSNPNRKTFLIVFALDDTTPGDTAVSSAVLNTSSGTAAFAARTAAHDDNTGAAGNSLRVSVLQLPESTATLDQGTVDTANAVTLTVTVVDTAGDPIENAQAAIYQNAETDTEIELVNGLTDGDGIVSTSFQFVSPETLSVRVRKGSASDDPKFIPVNSNQTVTADGLNVTITLQEDTNNNAF
jgi:hypothetical protein